ncbi:hypothetical protein GCM10009689_01030 [Brevibacterium antiquum]|uniref:hypothetical protein n=1 Tax=Brevibacterium antiquum TaxID=234835 RepID=UPI0018DF18E7|nr:hypothetical protein [Brevibacterium antiquum]
MITRKCDQEHHKATAHLSEAEETTFPGAYGDIRDQAEALRQQIACRRDSVPPGDVFSHISAALIHGLDPVLMGTPKVEISKRSPTRNYSSLYIYSRDLSAEETADSFAYPVTSLTRTLADLALDHSLEVSVPVVSQALRAGSVSFHDIKDRLVQGQRGRRRAPLALKLSNAEYESPSEAFCAVKFYRHGITGMVPQLDAYTDSGEFIGRNDFRHEKAPVVVEVHGVGKFYLNPNGPDEAAKRNHQRNMNLLNAGFTVFNLTFGDLFRPWILAEIKRSIQRTVQPISRGKTA